MFAMTKFSRRCRGQAVACDLVRAVLKCKNKLTAMRRNEAMRARLAEGFANYLVTDYEAGYPFRSSRVKYAQRRISVLNTGFQYHELGGHLDAPEYMAAGGMRWLESLNYGWPIVCEGPGA